uniref:Uncharacterized protein n=1 Tax=Setaria italica TaxID=4555 RepID=K4ANJ2_SETIT
MPRPKITRVKKKGRKEGRSKIKTKEIVQLLLALPAVLMVWRRAASRLQHDQTDT